MSWFCGKCGRNDGVWRQKAFFAELANGRVLLAGGRPRSKRPLSQIMPKCKIRTVCRALVDVLSKTSKKSLVLVK